MKRHRENTVVLYNVLFPVWMFFLYPTWLWLLIIPANFLIDSLVLYLAWNHQKKKGRVPKDTPFKSVYLRSIVKIWLTGFLGDILGALLNLGILLLLERTLQNVHYLPLYRFPWITLTAIPGVVLAGFVIYAMNKKYSFRKCALEEDLVRRLSLALAVFTAPYMMMLPIYG